MNQKDNVLQNIINCYNSLNKVEKKIARTIRSHAREIIHMAIHEVAELSGASDATVFRFCNKLGYEGFQDFKIHLASTNVSDAENFHSELNFNDALFLIKEKILSSNMYSMKHTIALNDDDVLASTCKLLNKATEIIFCGMGGSYSIAEDAYHKFVRTGKHCFVHCDPHWQHMYVSLASEKTILFLISNSGANKDLLELISYAKTKKIKIISITGNAKTPIAKKSDIALIAYGKESNFRSEAMESRLTALMLLDILYVKVAMDNKEQTLKNLNAIREAIAKKRI